MKYLKALLTAIAQAPWFSYCLLILLGGGLFAKTLSFDLTFLDDNVWLKDYLWYLKDLDHLGQIWTQKDIFFGGFFYRPMIYLSFFLDTQIGGGALSVYHATNIILHLINVLYVYLIFKEFRYHQQHCFWMAAIFAVHPTFAGAVAWIPGRTDTLLAFFIFPSFLFYLKYLHLNRLKFLIAHLILLLGALLTKESGVALFLMCVYVYLFIYPEKKKWRSILGQIFSWLLVGGVWFLLRKNALAQTPDIPPHKIAESLIYNSSAILTYLGKTIIPANLSNLPVIKDMSLIYGLVALAILKTLESMSAKKRGGHVYFGVVWFLAFLVPSLVLSFIKHEYRLYIPILGVMIVFLEALREHGREGQPSKALAKIAFVVTASFAALTFHQMDVYKDRWSFWKEAVKTSPHAPLAQRNLGAMYFLDGDLKRAKVYFERTLELNPRELMVHNNLGLIHAREGSFKRAEELYLKEIRINPTYDTVYYNLGLLYNAQGRGDLAESMWKKVLTLNPRYKNAYQQLLVLYFNEKKFDQAREVAQALKAMGASLPEGVGRKLGL